MTGTTGNRIRLFGLIGSLSRASRSLAVMRGIAGSVPPGVEIDAFAPDLPLYNQDNDNTQAAPPVHQFRRALHHSDGLLIVSPEYNHGIPGVLKNALDWASRPIEASSLANKPALVISNSTAYTGGARAQSQIHTTLLAAGARIVPGPEVVIGKVHEKIVEGYLIDRHTIDFAVDAIGRLVHMIEHARLPAGSLHCLYDRQTPSAARR